MCAIQMNPVCVVCVVTSDYGLFLVYLFVTEVTNPNDVYGVGKVYIRKQARHSSELSMPLHNSMSETNLC